MACGQIDYGNVVSAISAGSDFTRMTSSLHARWPYATRHPSHLAMRHHLTSHAHAHAHAQRIRTHTAISAALIANGLPPLLAVAVGMPQADGSVRPEPRMSQTDAANAVHYMSSLPLSANVLQVRNENDDR